MTAKDVLQGFYYCAGCCNIEVGNLNVPREIVNHYKVNVLVPDDYVCTHTLSQPLRYRSSQQRLSLCCS